MSIGILEYYKTPLVPLKTGHFIGVKDAIILFKKNDARKGQVGLNIYSEKVDEFFIQLILSLGIGTNFKVVSSFFPCK